MRWESAITCPKCGFQATETMPTDACQYLYDCKGCGQVIRPKQGDCCVFCSYGTTPCPPKQLELSGHVQRVVVRQNRKMLDRETG
jgi:hypothetical protein